MTFHRPDLSQVLVTHETSEISGCLQVYTTVYESMLHAFVLTRHHYGFLGVDPIKCAFNTYLKSEISRKYASQSLKYKF